MTGATTFSHELKQVITYSKNQAIDLQHDFIGIEHLMLAMMQYGSTTQYYLRKVGIDADALKQIILEKSLPASNRHESINIPLTKQAEIALKRTYLEANKLKSDTIKIEHLLLCILQDDNIVTQTFAKNGVDYDAMLKTITDYEKMSIDIEKDFNDPEATAKQLITDFGSKQLALLHVDYMIVIVGNINSYDGWCQECGAEHSGDVCLFFEKVKNVLLNKSNEN